MTDDTRPARPAQTEWTIDDLPGIHLVLTDERFGVPPADTGASPGTVGWLRASVSRFCNGPEHQRRRALVVAELDRLDPAALCAAARDRAQAALAERAAPPATAESTTTVIGGVARLVPAAALAVQFGVADPDRCADAVGAVAAAYFPGADAPTEHTADAATLALLDMLGQAGADQDTAVARITVMVQGHDATASLIEAALELLPELPEDCPTDELLAQTVRRRPPVRAIRRVAVTPAELGPRAIAEGDRVTCDIDAARRSADWADPGAGQPATTALTFGYGLRPCPGPGHALALAAGVIDAVRHSSG